LLGTAAAGLGAALPTTLPELLGSGAPRIASAATNAWRTQRGNDARTAYVAAGPTLATLRRLRHRLVAQGATVDQTEPVIAGSIVCWPTIEAGKPRLRRAGGGASWRVTLPAVPSSPTWDGGPVVVAGTWIYRFGANGVLQWSVAPPQSNPEFARGHGLGTRNGHVIASIGQDLHMLGLADGRVVSRTQIPNDYDVYAGGPPMIDERGTAWSVFQHYVAVGVPPDGVTPVVDNAALGNGATAAPVLTPGGRIFVGTPGHGLRYIDRNTGRRMEYGGGSGTAQRGLACDGTRLFYAYGSSTPRLDVWDLTTDTLLWTRTGARTAPLVWGSFVIVGEGGRGLVAYDVATGVEQWRYSGVARGADPVAVGTTLYAGYSPTPLAAGVNPPLHRFVPA
jgi:hypothetical protein